MSSLSCTLFCPTSHSLIHIISQSHLYGLRDSHNLVERSDLVMNSGRYFRLLFRISRWVVFLRRSIIALSLIKRILLERISICVTDSKQEPTFCTFLNVFLANRTQSVLLGIDFGRVLRFALSQLNLFAWSLGEYRQVHPACIPQGVASTAIKVDKRFQN